MRLEDYMQWKSMNRTDLAKACDLSLSMVSRILSGKRTPGRRAMMKIHDATEGNVTFADLISTKP